ncbi:hypothetical protein KUU03_19550 [Pseudomonas aeruginosa]|uniref:hypothetical protein n=1 Tax=Pseudomonas aeruginosa TaxID=287 RepID=UPI0003BB0A40|nr:hypothetical protein [Pseudomonas aeruginosa]ERZ29461.1 hypothetical protein Q003_02765 [Pseudomonas aeruginosa CF27]MBV5884508.1 hypothetical protein [Pseudomonas aeruginosa]MDI4123773.1 hypothetical protein [Pseudomonas aeruginosa]RPO68903.1 hypothetical protein IPC1173_24305 [Pseudomonas aeruginosa]RQI78857.1 hypothetical protein IPC12_25425 [Pseudomonas aeruginosa]
MNRQILAAAILNLFSLAFSQAGFAEESSLMTNRMVDANQQAIEHQQELSASAAQAGARSDS